MDGNIFRSYLLAVHPGRGLCSPRRQRQVHMVCFLTSCMLIQWNERRSNILIYFYIRILIERFLPRLDKFSISKSVARHILNCISQRKSVWGIPMGNLHGESPSSHWASSLDQDTYAERLGEHLGRGLRRHRAPQAVIYVLRTTRNIHMLRTTLRRRMAHIGDLRAHIAKNRVENGALCIAVGCAKPPLLMGGQYWPH